MSPDPASAVRIKGVGFVLGAARAGGGEDGTGEGSCGVIRRYADGVVDQFGLGVEDLLTKVDLVQRQPGRGRPVGGDRGFEFGVGGVHAGVDVVEDLVGQQSGGVWRRGGRGQQFAVADGAGGM